MASRFPLATPPTCPSCKAVASRGIVGRSNPNGNTNRYYYYCQSNHTRLFITWDDDRDTPAHNPKCWCGFPSRQNRRNGPKPKAWYGCSSRECSFREQIEVKNIAVELESTTPVRDSSRECSFREQIEVKNSAVELESTTPVRDCSESSTSDGGKGTVTETVVEANWGPRCPRVLARIIMLVKSFACGICV
ncbi:hypothetical protein B0J13DRAFT_149115 [Dactylonectria estremocensis]|uniref:GRF-like zinc ribbon domain-containing protein n=1 Tax=Dactylonectria estremocensis TaxID=1079267 RepID=A0A9P9DXZ3_9HYPO|nr:hypothetical protein B0J13DRAFT_149115 [Dactylonectria estremocensis]